MASPHISSLLNQLQQQRNRFPISPSLGFLGTEVSLPETHFAIPGGADVPLGDGLEHVSQPGPRENERGEGHVGCHGGRASRWRAEEGRTEMELGCSGS